MNRRQLVSVLNKLDKEGIYVFSYKDLKRWFTNESERTFRSALRRHIHEELLEHPCRDVYLNPNTRHPDGYVLEHMAITLRKGEYSYLSLESLLSEVGIISQIPINAITVMTTGRSQIIDSKYGRIEFTHTKRKIPDILGGTYKVQGRPLRLATKETALRDLRRVNRNLHMLMLEQDDD